MDVVGSAAPDVGFGSDDDDSGRIGETAASETCSVDECGVSGLGDSDREVDDAADDPSFAVLSIDLNSSDSLDELTDDAVLLAGISRPDSPFEELPTDGGGTKVVSFEGGGGTRVVPVSLNDLVAFEALTASSPSS